MSECLPAYDFSKSSKISTTERMSGRAATRGTETPDHWGTTLARGNQ